MTEFPSTDGAFDATTAGGRRRPASEDRNCPAKCGRGSWSSTA